MSQRQREAPVSRAARPRFPQPGPCAVFLCSRLACCGHIWHPVSLQAWLPLAGISPISPPQPTTTTMGSCCDDCASDVEVQSLHQETVASVKDDEGAVETGCCGGSICGCDGESSVSAHTLLRSFLVPPQMRVSTNSLGSSVSTTNHTSTVKLVRLSRPMQLPAAAIVLRIVSILHHSTSFCVF